MVTVEILAVGRELLIGRTLNTNAHWIGRRLALMGTMIKRMTTCDDDMKEIPASLRDSLSRGPDFLVVLGGLGPTPDDMTLRGIAAGLGRELTASIEAITLIRKHYAMMGIRNVVITRARKKMSILPKGSVPLLNTVGTAPGVRLESGGTIIFCLPGVPAEMRGIFKRSVEPEIREMLGKLHRAEVVLKVEGVYESIMAPLIGRELKRNPSAYIKSHPRGVKDGLSLIELDIAVVASHREEAETMARRIGREMTTALSSMGGRVTPAGRA